ncbi:hypothetical protein [Halopiger xanaduensis]|nr:hypothetical protein [Halopiger xanaduensis]
MSGSGLRRKVGWAIREGNTFQWFGAWGVKLSIEYSVSLLVSGVATGLGYKYMMFDEFNRLVGVNTQKGMLALISVLVLTQIFLCNYDIYNN